MFEVGFSELCLVGLVMLLVTKPNHFPAIAKVVLRRLMLVKDSFNRLKAEIKAEIDDASDNKHE